MIACLHRLLVLVGVLVTVKHLLGLRAAKPAEA